MKLEYVIEVRIEIDAKDTDEFGFIHEVIEYGQQYGSAEIKDVKVIE